MSRDRDLGNVRRAGSPRAASKRERERRDRRRERLVVYGTISVLAVATVVALVGLYLTQYRPPRAHVLTVGDSDYNAGDIARRATYEVLGGGVTPDLSVVLAETLQLIEDQEILLARAPAAVGEVTDDDIEAALREQLGFSDSDDDEGYGEALATLLRAVDLSRGEYEQLVAAQLLIERLDEQFRLEIGEEAEQLLVSRIRLADRGGAEDVRALVLDGADFAELAAERTAEADLAESGGELGWLPLGSFSNAARLAVEELQPGEVSEVVADGNVFDLYFVGEREQSRPLEAEQIDALLARSRFEWIEEQRGSVVVVRDLSDGEARWILERLVDNVSGGGAS